MFIGVKISNMPLQDDLTVARKNIKQRQAKLEDSRELWVFFYYYQMF